MNMLTASKPPLRSYVRLLSRLGWSLMLFLAMFVVSTSIVELVFEFLPSSSTTRALYGFFSTVAYAAPFILAGVIFRVMSKREAGKHDVEIVAPRHMQDRLFLPIYFPLLILAGLAINLIAAEINYYVCLLIGYTSSASSVWEPVYYDTPASAILYMTTAIAPAFAEEYLFRGVVYANLRPYGKWQAVILSAVTFSLMHQNIAQLLYTFVCGIVLALMYEWTGNIWCGIFFHMFNNELAVLSESLLYGAYGEDAYHAILVWDVAVILIGLASVAILIVYAVRSMKKKADAQEANPGIYGVNSLNGNTKNPEVWDRPLDGRSIRRGIRAPGMLTFIIVSLTTVFFDYLMMRGLL